jgi:hemerythrin-like domain-containing protein
VGIRRRHMKPRGPLMIEHRLIEKVLALAAQMAEKIRKENRVDTCAVYSVIDFIKTYADRTHHGKEEDILFKELGQKELSASDRSMMEGLISEHKTARREVAELLAANNAAESGDAGKISVIADKLKFLAGFYPAHIAKEDKAFFPNTEKYFTAGEQGNMLEEFWKFDRAMIHEKYNKAYESLKAKV